MFETNIRLGVSGSVHFNENHVKLSSCARVFLYYLWAYVMVSSREMTPGYEGELSGV